MSYAGRMVSWRKEDDFHDAANGSNWRVALAPALETEVGTICPHFGLLFQHTPVVLRGIMLRLSCQCECNINHRDARRRLVRLTHLLHMAPSKRRKLLL